MLKIRLWLLFQQPDALIQSYCSGIKNLDYFQENNEDKK